MPDWDPEVEVDGELARALIAAQFPELRGVEVRPLAMGWDNAVFLVDRRWAFRFPRRAIAIPGVEREIQLLPRLGPNLPLPVPQPRWVGVPAEGYPWPWWGGPFLAGADLAEADLADADREPLAAALGAFVRALHHARLSRVTAATMPVDPMRRGDMAVRVPATRARLREATEAGAWEPRPELDGLLERATGLPAPPRTVVVHGDLHMRHVLVDDGGGAAGVIDWGDVASGDPSLDLSLAYAAFAGEPRRAFLEAYGPVDGLTELRARVIGAFLAAALLAYAADQGLAGVRAEARRSLERVVT